MLLQLLLRLRLRDLLCDRLRDLLQLGLRRLRGRLRRLGEDVVELTVRYSRSSGWTWGNTSWDGVLVKRTIHGSCDSSCPEAEPWDCVSLGGDGTRDILTISWGRADTAA